MESAKPYRIISQKQEKDGTAIITAEITAEELERHKKEALRELSANLSLPGFRKGFVPPAIAETHVPHGVLLEETAEETLRATYPAILDELDWEPVSAPRISITKLAFGNPLAVTITTALAPHVTLPNYHAIAKKVLGTSEKIEATDEEVETFVKELLALGKQNTGASTAETSAPELTDEEARKLGPFETAAALKTKIRENIEEQKRAGLRRKKQEDLIERIAEASKCEPSSILVDEELEQAKEQLKRELAEHKSSFEEFLERAKKTEQELWDEERKRIGRALKARFVLEVIAEKEAIEAAPEEVEREYEALQRRFAGARPDTAKAYLARVLKTEKTVGFLENIGKE